MLDVRFISKYNYWMSIISEEMRDNSLDKEKKANWTHMQRCNKI